MRGILAVLMLFTFSVTMLALVEARGAPPTDHSFAVAKVQVSPVAPMVSSVPPLTVGYDVIQNLSDSKTITPSVTTERRRQSTTGAWQIVRRGPEIVMLA